MAAELVETSKLWGRQNAAIDPLWAERLGGDLVKRTLLGAVLVEEARSRRWPTSGSRCTASRWSPTASYPSAGAQPDVARELFVRHALVQGEWRARHRFFETNRRLLEEAAELEHRARRHDIVVDEETLFDFYDARVPADVVSGAHFDTWWKKERTKRPDLLTFDPSMLVHEGAALDEGDFPDEWHEGPLTLPLRYHFEPGHEADGVTIDVPLATLNTVGPAPFTWNVPGLRHELVTALIRSLPKQLRVNFVPAPDVARRFLEAVPPGEEPLLDALSRYLRSLTGVHVPPDAWDVDEGAGAPAPDVPRPRRRGCRGRRRQGPRCAQGAVAAVLRPGDARGRRRVRTRCDRADGRGPSAPSSRRSPRPAPATRCTASRRWSTRARTVGLRVAASQEEQEAEHRLGVRRLLLLAVPSPAACTRRRSGQRRQARRWPPRRTRTSAR